MPVTHHALHLADRAKMTAMRAMLALAGKPALEPTSRPATDELMAKIAMPCGVTVEPAQVGSIGGWWCRPAEADPKAAILYLHGGAYVLGSAWAYRGFAGQIAALAGAATFVADYALAPERPFPDAFDDARATYDGLIENGFERIALCGDSAGGGLTLALLLALSDAPAPPVGAVAMSPWIDLSCSGATMDTRVDRDPLLSRETLTGAARLYLGDADPNDPRGNALAGDVGSMPPVRIHVGDDEVLLDDTLRFAAAAEAAGRVCEAHVWEGMIHVFPSNASLDASEQARQDIGAFLRERLAPDTLSEGTTL